MKIALLGYGKMGRVIEQIALDRGHEITARIDLLNKDERSNITTETADAVIEFSSPHSAYDNLKYCMGNGLKTISGTTGWLEHRSEIETLCNKNNAAFFYASNFSIGVNLFFKLNKQLAKLMNNQSGYELVTYEIHHTEKKDSPSGTAITLAEGIMEENTTKGKWINNELPENNAEVPIWSSREGKVPGTHTIKYISDVDTIEMTHTAHSRQGFALGAVIAAEWLADKTGVRTMEEMLSE
ncbi:MAG: 4-hydroxy-tetrahydrodipicolinate reductase [Spirosomataceae bacterium]|jgi:4-hydroxy-tetrahydrodipicolinate reductase